MDGSSKKLMPMSTKTWNDESFATTGIKRHYTSK